jgi:hypothetical protein
MKTIYITRNDLFKNISMLLCNKITEVDPNFIEDNYEIFYDNCDGCDGTGEKDGEKCEECYGEGRHDSEPYQYFLTSISEYTKEYLESFGVVVGYSNSLDLEVIPIFDYGTSWSCFSYSKEVEDDYTLGYNETLTRSTVY